MCCRDEIKGYIYVVFLLLGFHLKRAKETSDLRPVQPIKKICNGFAVIHWESVGLMAALHGSRTIKEYEAIS